MRPEPGNLRLQRRRRAFLLREAERAAQAIPVGRAERRRLAWGTGPVLAGLPERCLGAEDLVAARRLKCMTAPATEQAAREAIMAD